MTTTYPDGRGTSPQLRPEVCDKCDAGMSLQGSGLGFERWACPDCHQVVGIDRDPETGGRSQLDRGHPWRYTRGAFAR